MNFCCQKCGAEFDFQENAKFRDIFWAEERGYEARSSAVITCPKCKEEYDRNVLLSTKVVMYDNTL